MCHYYPHLQMRMLKDGGHVTCPKYHTSCDRSGCESRESDSRSSCTSSCQTTRCGWAYFLIWKVKLQQPGPAAMAHFKTEQDDWLIVYLKYLLFVFNFFFWYFCLLLVIFLVELVAGVLAHVYYQRLSDELKQHLNQTLTKNYGQPGATQITASVDRLQQDFKCCGSTSSADWQRSTYILSREAEGRWVPDSCCKTVVVRCGRRAHPSNIYKVEGGCLTKLEQFLADHLLLMGAVGIGVACLQICGMVLTCCLHRRLQRHFY
ncbi:tetraspanin-11 isoform X2 [Sapajus apella]|uniref:Tetraspanin-11 isoform X2 n=1 Tax=Sapajus apella TaxID=9515 RepID=A0A6J3H3P6_SAPAP|nr:tetraspanin-11 isoform X2 [Sapajus apella]